MGSVTILLSEEELSIVMSGLDLLVKQGGLNVASKVLPVASKLSDASKEPKGEEVTE